MTAILRSLILMLLFLPVAVWAGDETEPPAELSQLVALALAQNPEIAASEARWQSFVQRARQAGTFEDPMLMLRVQNVLVRDPFSFDREDMTSKVIGLSQMVPFYGKRDLQRRSAELDAEASRWAVEERKLELTRMVKETWYQIYAVDRALEVVGKNIGLLDDLSRFTETMYGVGQNLQQDVLKSQVERSKMEDLRLSLEQRRRTLSATLNTLLFRPAATDLEPIGDFDLDALELTSAQLERMAEENRPLLRSLAAQVDKARVGRQLAEKDNYPDFTLSLEYMQREQAMDSPGYDMYSAGVTFNLPVQRERRAAMVAEAESETRMGLAELDMARNQIRLAIADGVARLERARRLVSLYRDGIIPQAGSSLEAAMAAYRVGKSDFMNVLDSQMTLFNFEREYFDLLAEHQMTMAQLEAVVGAPLGAADKQP